MSEATIESTVINGVNHYACEVCGKLTPNFVTDITEVEPVIKPNPRNGDKLEPFLAFESDGPPHPLCNAHMRQHREKAYFKNNTERVKWLLAQPGYCAAKTEAELEQLRAFVARGEKSVR